MQHNLYEKQTSFRLVLMVQLPKGKNRCSDLWIEPI